LHGLTCACVFCTAETCTVYFARDRICIGPLVTGRTICSGIYARAGSGMRMVCRLTCRCLCHGRNLARAFAGLCLVNLDWLGHLGGEVRADMCLERPLCRPSMELLSTRLRCGTDSVARYERHFKSGSNFFAVGASLQSAAKPERRALIELLASMRVILRRRVPTREADVARSAIGFH